MMQASVPFYITPLESWIHDEYDIGDGKPITVAPTNATGHVLPLVIHNNGQCPSETMEQFLSRRQQYNENLR